MGGVNLPEDHCFAAISEPLGIGGHAFMTFPEYEFATGWRIQAILDNYQESNMAAGKPKILWNQPTHKLSLLVSQMKMKFERLSQNCRLCSTQIWHCLHGPTSGSQNGGQETGNGNNILRSGRWLVSGHVCNDVPESVYTGFDHLMNEQGWKMNHT